MDWEKMNMLTQKKIDTIPSKKNIMTGEDYIFLNRPITQEVWCSKLFL